LACNCSDAIEVGVEMTELERAFLSLATAGCRCYLLSGIRTVERAARTYCRVVKASTIEGIAPDGEHLSPLQDAFSRHGGFQCGICTPGQIMAAY